MMEQEIDHKTLSWKVKKVGDGDYRVIRPHKFIMVVDEYDTGAFPFLRGRSRTVLGALIKNAP